MVLVNGGYLHCTDIRKFLSESDKKKKWLISKIQVSDSGPSWPSCFEMAMKQPTLTSFHFKKLSNDQDKLLPRTTGENTDACSPAIPDTHGPQKTL